MQHCVVIREACPEDSSAIRAVHIDAFKNTEEADLVAALTGDRGARNVLSLVAELEGNGVVGHVLFSLVGIEGQPGVVVYILCPMAVKPPYQRQGIGGKLVLAGFDRLQGRGADLVLVLGDPAYYSKHGFEPALPLGLVPPHPTSQSHPGAWSVKALSPATSPVPGRVLVPPPLDAPELWAD
uniref:Putative acetyltransferase n=1 Tax=Tetraselmis sp. GSL018 TaxID=582737 RepID=A0A061QZ00_9CHLO|eukprot:CAMPEP_0177610822 /NCGR_PEP_ID=MMETSP0419_2-20121207/20042_1 /TAXON_ID=582737 /ORGANISM="Tetraselmis sp., Strain GSL018" /LENGTH=181 /DNA_ID=CAMNT_0019106269 /DNA_START=260 /DNA_END=805 /DNA_ORIENTATION=+